MVTLFKRLWRPCLFIALLLLVASASIFMDWLRDNAVLRQQAIEVTHGSISQSTAIVALNHWVYRNQGFAKNHYYFLVRALGPTPLQIMRFGGDCSDKSRLLSAMLYQLGIRSGLVMIYPCSDCKPIHTVVEAVSEHGRMVVDPIWNIDYPGPDGTYLGVQKLAGTSDGRNRLAQLKAQSGRDSNIAAMPPAEATFDYARALNWRKNSVMRGISHALRCLGIQSNGVLRPRVLEDPQLAIAMFLLTSGLAFGVIAVASLRLVARRTRRPTPPHHAWLR